MTPLVLTGSVGVIALAATAFSTPLVRRWASSAGAVQGVRDDRWHRRPTPAVGGVAIYLGVVVALGSGAALAPELLVTASDVSPRARIPVAPWQGLLGGATLAFFLGLVDDVVELSPLAKVGGQLLAALVLLLSGIGVWLTGVYPVDVGLSLLWFLAVTNALNLLDNMDGVAAGTAVIAAGIIAVLLALAGEAWMALVAVAVAGAAGGFLAHNYPPARIFMGDSGALFLGLLLAGLALAPSRGLSRSLAGVVLIPAAVLALPLLDTTLVTVSRILEGRSIAQGGRDHTAHRLVSLGVGEERAMWILWGVAATGGAAALVLRAADRGVALLVGALMLVTLGLLGTFLLRVRLRILSAAARGGDAAPLVDAVATLHGRIPLLAIAMDAILVAAAYYGAYLVRWDAAVRQTELVYFGETVALVVATKVAAFTLGGLYRVRWGRYGLVDALRTARASVLGSLAAGVLLLLVARVGLGRGVLLVDLGLCTALLVASRASFRVFDGATRSLIETGRDAVLLASVDDLDLLRRIVEGAGAPGGAQGGFRPVAGVDPELEAARTHVGRLVVFGGDQGLAAALARTGAGAVVVLDDDPGGSLPSVVRDHLERSGGVDVYRVRLTVEPVEGRRRPAPTAVPGSDP
jgi:UDP-GlcNAc:undecaprenyl-phosphate GlcNAc-1-phosphate transferase